MHNYSLKRIEHRIERLENKVKNLKAKEELLSVHGARQLGYYEGILSELYDIRDELVEGTLISNDGKYV